jgi:insulin receptor substrate 1
MYQGSSSAHSRASSLAEENTDGYVPMSGHTQDTYVEMDGHIQRTLHEGMSSAASSCSHHSSGTPSTDMRFSEYPLEKVVSAFTQSEDDESTLDMRPLRTYSVGSRLEHNKRKMRVDVINAEHFSQNPRVRAFSVGSRAKVPRSELYKSSLTHTQQAAANDKESFNNNNSTTVATASGKKGKKSNSAPILMKCPGSIDRMDDLMEIDFSKTSTTPVKTSSPVPVPKTKPRMSDYMDMSPRTRSSPSGYVEMKPGVVLPSTTQTEHDYLDMTPGGGGTTTGLPYILSCSPILRNNLTGTSPKEISLKSLKINNNCDYIDMSPKTTSSSAKSMSSAKQNTIGESPKTSSEDYLNMSPGEKMLDAVGSLPKSNASSSAPDGYMEMSWNQKNKNNEKRTSEEYINVGSHYSQHVQHQQHAKSFTSHQQGSTNQDSRLTSQPINILAKSSGRPTKTLTSIATTTNNFLPPSNNNTILSGHTPSKTITKRCDSRDSGIATPSGSHPTIFAFSPSSPKKPFIVPTPTILSEVS